MSLDGNSWEAWSKHVLKELERLNENYDDLKKDVNSIKVDIAMLKLKSGIWGLLGGLIPLTLMIILWLLKTQNN